MCSFWALSPPPPMSTSLPTMLTSLDLQIRRSFAVQRLIQSCSSLSSQSSVHCLHACGHILIVCSQGSLGIATHSSPTSAPSVGSYDCATSTRYTDRNSGGHPRPTVLSSLSGVLAETTSPSMIAHPWTTTPPLSIIVDLKSG